MVAWHENKRRAAPATILNADSGFAASTNEDSGCTFDGSAGGSGMPFLGGGLYAWCCVVGVCDS